MTWQNRPKWRFDELPLHQQRDFLDSQEMLQQESRRQSRQSRWVLLVCIIGMILIVVWSLWWWP